MPKELKIIRRNKDFIIRYRERNKNFVFNWTDVLKWDGDPFQNKIFHPEEDFIAGYTEQRKKLNLFILRAQPVAFIRGENGMGKTQLLSWLDYELHYDKNSVTKFLRAGKASLFTFKRKIIHPILPLSAKIIDTLYFRFGFRKLKHSFHDELFEKPVLKLLPKLYDYFFMKPYLSLLDEDIILIMQQYLQQKRFILMLDDASDLSTENIGFVQYLLEQNIPMQLIIADTKTRLQKSPWKNVKQDVTLDLSSLSFTELALLLKKRIQGFNGQGVYPLSEKQVKQLVKKAEYNPKKLLQLTRDLVIQITVERLRRRQTYETQDASKKIPELKLTKDGGVHIETVLPQKISSGKTLSDQEQKAQKSMWKLSKEFVKNPVDYFYKDYQEEAPKRDPSFFDVKEKKQAKPKKISQEAKETERVIEDLSREFARR